jgi:hypothetical protein
MTDKIKRSQFRTFINTGTALVSNYKLMGDGVTDASIDYNPSLTTEQYITEDSSTTSLDSYAPSMPIDATAKLGDEVFAYVDAMRKDRAIQAAANTDIINVWLYEIALDLYDTIFPAEQQNVTIAINNFGGAANVGNKINYTLHYQGDPVVGTFDIVSRVFTPS